MKETSRKESLGFPGDIPETGNRFKVENYIQIYGFGFDIINFDLWI